jgi:hypothetical protein
VPRLGPTARGSGWCSASRPSGRRAPFRFLPQWAFLSTRTDTCHSCADRGERARLRLALGLRRYLKMSRSSGLVLVVVLGTWRARPLPACRSACHSALSHAVRTKAVHLTRTPSRYSTPPLAYVRSLFLCCLRFRSRQRCVHGARTTTHVYAIYAPPPAGAPPPRRSALASLWLRAGQPVGCGASCAVCRRRVRRPPHAAPLLRSGTASSSWPVATGRPPAPTTTPALFGAKLLKTFGRRAPINAA